MVDSRAKGSKAESDAKDFLKKLTKLNWQRTPSSGALAPVHGLKGDLYIPNKENIFCVEVKHYKDDHLTSKILNGKSPQFFKWWEQTVRESLQVSRTPLLVFKYDRSKWFAAVRLNDMFPMDLVDRTIIISNVEYDDIVVLMLEEFCKHTEEWIK